MLLLVSQRRSVLREGNCARGEAGRGGRTAWCGGGASLTGAAVSWGWNGSGADIFGIVAAIL